MKAKKAVEKTAGLDKAIGTPFRPRRTPVSNFFPKAIYVHMLDSTENIPGNRPQLMYTSNKENPFGVPGEDYSEGFEWTFRRYVPSA